MKQKQYKLVQWYPSLPDKWKDQEGLKVEEISGPTDGYIHPHKPLGVGVRLPSKEVENNPEFWKKVKEKDYEILSFKNKCASKANYKLNSEGLYIYSGCLPPNTEPSETSLEKMLEYETIEIYSVKRLSDGEVFTLGDKINAGIDKCSSILSFRIDDSGQVIAHIKLGSYYLSELEHIDTPVFTTEDGVDIYEGDQYWRISSVNSTPIKLGNEFFKEHCSNYLYFSTKEKAEEYIEEHKLRYSKADIKEALSKSLGSNTGDLSDVTFKPYKFKDLLEL